MGETKSELDRAAVTAGERLEHVGNRRRRGATPRAVIHGMRPELADAGAMSSGIEHGHRRLVAEHARRSLDHPQLQLIKALEPPGGTLHPAGECRAEVTNALGRRAQRLVEMGLATTKDGKIHIPVRTVATLERQEVERVGHQMARDAGEYVSGRLAGIASLVSGRFAIIENGLGFQLVPWQPILEKRIGQHITGLQRGNGGIEWTLGRNRGLSL
jgi:hypothetical protein